MSENEVMYNLLQGLKQLEVNLQLLRATHEARGLDTNNSYTTITENILKLEYVDKSLELLRSVSPPSEVVGENT